MPDPTPAPPADAELNPPQWLIEGVRAHYIVGEMKRLHDFGHLPKAELARELADILTRKERFDDAIRERRAT